MSKIDQAVAVFGQGYVCSQAILAVYGEGLGMDQQMALKLAAGFGGGMATTGQTCGAVTGALMVIGLAMGHVTSDDDVSKSNTYRAVTRFMTEFERAHGSVNCNTLVKHDLGNPEGFRLAKESGVFTRLCPQFVASAARILEGVLTQE